ncbi:MAG: CPBP family intramembrane metalloprotease [Ruminococcus flavefaciens]|nr:CPBP family intramembrane metalloprotease [Ruminococcus flavefaciens]
MSEEYYRAEISALNNEIYRLNRQIEEERKNRLPDKLNPFDNPTEYPEFSGDYSDIMPELDAPECTIPLEPELTERRKIKRFYSIGGWALLGQFFISNVLALLASYIIKTVISSRNAGVDTSTISDYMNSSSIFAGINMLAFVIANIGFAFMGLSMARIPKSLLIRTRDFSAGKAFQYCLTAFFLWTVSLFVSSGINDMFEHYGYTTNVMSTDGMAVTGTGFAVMTVYTCVVAPLTEEIFFRGMLLRVFSRTNQRFAVFATAFFFGLSHHNIPQFVLAFLLGTFLAHITLKHNSVIPAVIVHVFINTMSTAISYIAENAGFIFTSVLILVMAVMGFFLLCLFREKNRIPSTTPAQVKRGFCVAKSSVMFVIATVVQIIYTLLLIFM